MHILLIHQVFITPNQGGGTRHYELSNYLIQNGHQVTVIASDSDYFTATKKVDKNLPDGLTLKYVKAYGGHNKGIMRRAISFFHFSLSCFFVTLRTQNVDIIWSTSPPLFQCITAWIAAKIKRKPFVMEVRDLWLDFAVQLGVVKKGFLYFFFKKIERFLYRHSTEIIVNSPGFIPYIQPIVPAKKIHLFANGVIAEEFELLDLKKVATHKKKMKAEDEFVVIYAGNLGKANDIECILDSAEGLRDLHPKIRFVLMGGGLLKEDLKKDCQKRNLFNVLFMDPIPKDQMSEVLHVADVCIASLKNIPLFATVYPNKVFDYMAAAKPTILSIDGAIKKVILDSKGGKFIPPGDSQKLSDAIVEYYQNPDLIKEHGENARSYVKTYFNREDIAIQLADFFRSLLKNPIN